MHRSLVKGFIEFTHKTDSQNSGKAVVLIWCLKKVKDVILEFTISESFFSEKQRKNCLDYIL